MSIKRCLSRAGLRIPISVAHNGEEAFEVLRANGADGRGIPFVILLDLNMPVMSGIEFLGALRQDPVLSASVVFVMSTSDSPFDIECAYSFQAAGYIVKDSRAGMLTKSMDMIRNYLDVVRLPYGTLALK